MVLAVPAVAWAADRSLSRPTRPHTAVRAPAIPSAIPDGPRYAVGVRTLKLSRGADRPLRTLLFYPAVGVPRPIPATAPTSASPTATTPAPTASSADVSLFGLPPAASPSPTAAASSGPSRAEPCPASPPGAPATALPGEPMAAPARGRFPLVLFSHGLAGTPERYAPAAATWAAAGFVVAVPAFPHTCAGAPRFRRSDIVHQPDDARYVLQQIRRLDRRPDDPLYGRIDRNRVAAVGHSAGGYTTTGLFTARHPEWLRAGVVIAGWRAPGAFAGRPAAMLFLQGDADHVVPLSLGRAAFDAVPWPKSYVLIPRAHHAGYMLPGRYGWRQMNAIVTDFLRWTLTRDDGARWRLPASGLPATETDPSPTPDAAPTGRAAGPAPARPARWDGPTATESASGAPTGHGAGMFHRPFEDRP
ncbi:hypothetical protein KRMM14A1004_07950 [Krasilnikovia sp. MM14-A1004]